MYGLGEGQCKDSTVATGISAGTSVGTSTVSIPRSTTGTSTILCNGSNGGASASART